MFSRFLPLSVAAIALNLSFVPTARADFWQDLFQAGNNSNCRNPSTQQQVITCNQRFYVEGEVSQVFYEITGKNIDNNSLQVLTNNVLTRNWQYNQVMDDIIKHHGGQRVAKYANQRFNLNQFAQTNPNNPWGNTTNNANNNYGVGQKVRLTQRVNLFAQPNGNQLIEQVFPGEVILIYPDSRRGNYIYAQTFQTQQGGWIEVNNTATNTGNNTGNWGGDRGELIRVSVPSVILTQPGSGRVVRELARGETVRVYWNRRSGNYVFVETADGRSGWTQTFQQQ